MKEFSGKQAYRYAERIAQYHRIQASIGYRDAANEVMKLLKRDGVDAELVAYPAQFGERFLSHKSFQEWHCQSAELWVETPVRKRIARFEEEEISLVQRSTSTPKEGLTTELIIIDNAEEEESYQGLDIKGKIALVRGNPVIIHALAVEKYKAAGLIFDNLYEYPPIRTRMDMPDTRQYTSYWWHNEEEVKSFGFVVSPRISEELRDLAAKSTVKLYAQVDAKLYDGQLENVEYFIPGKKKQEILLVSHLCHPYPGGQDNAAGPGTLMEVMRSLTRLIEKGSLHKPELGIRFLMMPEMNGTCAYLDQHPERIPYTVAALNLDMVGADQSKGGGPLCIEQPPMAVPTFVDRYAYKLVEELSRNTKNFTGTTEYSTVHYVKTRFSGGSDHYILSDSAINIPCPMFIQWPDRHYHSTADNPQNLDPNMMELVGSATVRYAYGLANGDEAEWTSYLFDHIGQSVHAMVKAKVWISEKNLTPDEAQKTLEFYTNYEMEALDQFSDYAELRGFQQLQEHILWAKQRINDEGRFVKELLEKELSLSFQQEGSPTKSEEWMQTIYRRTFSTPLRMVGEINQLSVEQRVSWLKDFEANVPMVYADFLFYWMDGKRTVEEILQITKHETGEYHLEYTKELMSLCKHLNLIKVQKGVQTT